MNSEWTVDKEMTLHLQGDGQDPWKIPRRYRRKKGRDGVTPNSVRRASKTPKVTTDVKEEKVDFLHSQEVNRI